VPGSVDPQTTSRHLPPPDAALTDVQQFRRDVDTLNPEQQRAKARSTWLLAMGIVGMVASLLWPVVKRYFS
jgi:hypothetical protein